MAVATGSILVAVAVFAVAAVLLVSHQLRSTLDSALRQRATDVAQLAVSAPAVLTEPGALESPESGRQIVVEVIDDRGRLLARSLTLGSRLLPQDRVVSAARVAGRTGYEDIRVDGRPYRLYAAPIAQAGGAAAGGAVIVASDTTDIGNTVHRIGVLLALIGIAAALVVAVVAAVLTRRGLLPLHRLAVAAGEIEQTADVSRRLPPAPTADEVGQLTGVLNRMLASLDDARAGERRFLADASHELRTPVTSLLGNVEYAARHGLDPEVLGDLRRDAERLARLVDDLLVLERAGAARGGAELEPVELGQFVRSALGDGRFGRELEFGPTVPATVRADRDALARALGNLVENAFVHGPAGTPVTVSVSRVGDRAMITVSDAGRGPDRDDHAHLFERFWRGTAAATRPGSGLGLSIVAAIAAQLGGGVTVSGSAFTIELPAMNAELHATDAESPAPDADPSR
ncbi:MAG TPA: HAMP domain-containing sensor histidine kinase [Solirubrobacteraceae bacterium]|nr:HAMP domain-containing sensor histidine kinase [Solirubrobacteraceae bacterium]